MTCWVKFIGWGWYFSECTILLNHVICFCLAHHSEKKEEPLWLLRGTVSVHRTDPFVALFFRKKWTLFAKGSHFPKRLLWGTSLAPLFFWVMTGINTVNYGIRYPTKNSLLLGRNKLHALSQSQTKPCDTSEVFACVPCYELSPATWAIEVWTT